MKLAQASIERFEEFLDKLQLSAVPEGANEMHQSITRQMTDYMIDKHALPLGGRVLDVGCGQGLALDLFRERGMAVTGISTSEAEVSVCRDRGHEVALMDQSFLDFEADSMDLVWCRHRLEQSIFPYFTLSGFQQVLKAGGFLYLEVPAPDTNGRHQANPSRYSVLSKSMWSELLSRAGFDIMEQADVNVTVEGGSDLFWIFICKKPIRQLFSLSLI